jgi:hypothetical protein
VVRRQHPTHGKMSQIEITVKGKNTLDSLKQEVPKFRDYALRNISNDSKKETQTLLKVIINNCMNNL